MHHTPPGVQVRQSARNVKETIDRLQAFLQQHGVTIYARIDQQAEVARAGQHIGPLEFLMFGNPKAGGPVMAENPLAALDLPLKVIAWEDAQGQTWFAYNEEPYIRERFSLHPEITGPLNLDGVIGKALAGQ